jgi:hypothetical protein
MIKLNLFRPWLVRWIYAIAFAHFAAGIWLAWFSDSIFFDDYHQAILNQVKDLSAGAHILQVWWLSLFGATLQNLAVFMAALTFVGNKFRCSAVWVWMMLGLILWAPQDILISLQLNLWLHMWVDLAVLIVMLPPLGILWWLDCNNKK